MADLRTIQYRCKLASGTGTAGPYLTPFFQAWADARGIKLWPGTLNLCAHRDVAPPADHVSLKRWDGALKLPSRKSTPGYDPRLYLINLDGVPGWLFRWSDMATLGNFVEDTSDCVVARRCEVVAETELASQWSLATGGEVTFNFV